MSCFFSPCQPCSGYAHPLIDSPDVHPGTKKALHHSYVSGNIAWFIKDGPLPLGGMNIRTREEEGKS